jgi:hypothetical protein
MKNPTAELIERARKYMAKRYGRDDMQATEDGNFFYMSKPSFGAPYKSEVGYVCVDGALWDNTGDRDEKIANLN